MKNIVITVFLFSYLNFFAQNHQSRVLEFESKVLKSRQELDIFLPENYDEQSNSFPVVYLLDGQNWFSTGKSLHKVFTGNETNFKSIPDFILVGIRTNWKERRNFYSTNKASEFLMEEVIRLVDKNYRTTNERILFGWQFAGGFVMRSFAKNQDVFKGFLAATPVFYDPSKIDSLFSKKERVISTLFFSGTKEEENTWVKPTIDILNKSAPKSFNWRYKEISANGAFGHRISPVETISYGLRMYFHDYPILEFKNISEFYEKGGINFVNDYYSRRSKRYNLPKDMGHWGRYVLVRLAIRENHFSTFELLMNEFSDTDFVRNLRVSQLFVCAELFLHNKRPRKSLELYENILRREVENVKAINGLGKAHLLDGNKEQAKKYFNEAVEIALKKGDKNLEKYKIDLENVEK